MTVPLEAASTGSSPLLKPEIHLKAHDITSSHKSLLIQTIMSDSVNFKLTANRYGKDMVRVLRVLRPTTPGGKQTVLEFNVQLMLEGGFETRQA